ncbi:hypothetical protein OC834_003347 [Tilletia horrida]|nr:hypothetical protein OC834_003347 [Tilletia horrida]
MIAQLRKSRSLKDLAASSTAAGTAEAEPLPPPPLPTSNTTTTTTTTAAAAAAKMEDAPPGGHDTSAAAASVLSPSLASPVMMHSVSEDTGASLLLHRKHMNGSTTSVLLSPRSGKASSLYGSNDDAEPAHSHLLSQEAQAQAQAQSQAQTQAQAGIGLGLGGLSLRMRPGGWFDGSTASASVSSSAAAAAAAAASSGSALATSQEFSPRTGPVVLSPLPPGVVPISHRRGRRSSSSSRASGPAIMGSASGSAPRPPSVRSAGGGGGGGSGSGGAAGGSAAASVPPTPGSTGAPSIVGGSTASGRRSSSNTNLRTRMDILANANLALAQGHHRTYVFATPSPPASATLASPATASLGGSGVAGGSGSSAAPSPMPMPRGRSVSTFTTSSSIGGSIGHGGHSAVNSPFPHHHHHHQQQQQHGAYLSAAGGQFVEGMPVFAEDGSPAYGAAWMPSPSPSSGRRASGAASDMYAPVHSRSRSRSPHGRMSASAHEFAAAYELHAGGIDPRRLSSSSGTAIGGRAMVGGGGGSGCSSSASTRARNRLSLPDADGMGNFASSSLSLTNPHSISPGPSPRSAHFGLDAQHHPHQQLPVPSYFQGSPAQHSPWFNNTSPHTPSASHLGVVGSQGPHVRSPYASGQAGRLQPIPATAPPSEDGHSSNDGHSGSGRYEAQAELGVDGDLETETRIDEVSSGGRRIPSDSTSASYARHGVDKSSGSGSGTIDCSLFPTTGPLTMPSSSDREGTDSTWDQQQQQQDHVRVVSPGGAGHKTKRRGRKALSEKLKRRSKRISANPSSSSVSGGLSSHHAARTGSGSVDDDRSRRNAAGAGGGREHHGDSDGGDEESVESADEGDADERDDFDETDAADESGAEMDDADERYEAQKRAEESGLDGVASAAAAAAASAAAVAAEAHSRPNSRRHRAFTSPVQKLASASTSTLDFGSQLGLQEGSRRTSAASSVGTAGSPGGASLSGQQAQGQGQGQGHGKRIITPTSPLLLPSSPSSPIVGPVSHASASGVFMPKSGAAVAPGAGTRYSPEGRENTSPIPDLPLQLQDGSSSSAAAASLSRAATSSSTTPRLPLAVLSPEQQQATSPSGISGGDAKDGALGLSEGRPVLVGRARQTLRRLSAALSGGGYGHGQSASASASASPMGLDEEDTFFDADESGASISPMVPSRSSDLTMSSSASEALGGRLEQRARSSTLVGSPRPVSSADGTAAKQAGATMLTPSQSAGSGLSIGSDSLGVSPMGQSSLSSSSGGDDSLVGSSEHGSNVARPQSGSKEQQQQQQQQQSASADSEPGRSILSFSSSSSASSPVISPTGNEYDAQQAAGEQDEAAAAAEEGSSEAWLPMGGRAGDPLSTATLRQDASQQAKMQGSASAAGAAAVARAGSPMLSNADSQDSLRRLHLEGQSQSLSQSQVSPKRPATLIRTRTGSILPMARELPTTPPPLAPLHIHGGASAQVTPIVIESPATPETPAASAFAGPMQILTGMPSPDLQMIEPQAFSLRPLNAAEGAGAGAAMALTQATLRGRPRGASVGAVPGNYTPLRPSSLAASTTSLAPLKQSPSLGADEQSMAQWRDQELELEHAGASTSTGTGTGTGTDAEMSASGSGGSDAHRRSGSGADGSTSSHLVGDDSGSPGGGAGSGSGSGSAAQHAISAGVSDHTNTSHSQSATSFAPTDVSSSDTSVSVHEAELDTVEGPLNARLSHDPQQFPSQQQHQHISAHKQQSPAQQRTLTFQHPTQERLPSTGNVETGSVSSLKNRARARSLGVASHSNSLTPTPGQTSTLGVSAGLSSGSGSGSSGSGSGAAPAPATVTATATGRSRSGSSASLHRQAQLPLRSPASFVLAVVGHRGAGKTTVIKRGLKQYGLSKPNSLSEKVTSYSTFCLVDNSERTIEVLEIDAAVLLNGPTKRFSWPKFLPSIDAVILCYDASEVSSFRSMSELLENFSVHGVRTVMLACKSDMEPKALNPYYASEMAAMYNVGLAECTYHTEEGRKRMRNCFSYLVKGVAKARAGKGSSRSSSVRQGSQLSVVESDSAGTDGSNMGPVSAQQLVLGPQADPVGRARGNSVPNVRFSLSNRSAASMYAESVREEGGPDGAGSVGGTVCRLTRQDPYHRCSARCSGGAAASVGAGRKMSNATNDGSEPLSMSNSEDEGSSDQRHRSMMRNAKLGLQSAKSAGGYDSIDELYNKFFYAAVSNTGRDFATTFMIFYRGFAKPIDLLMQAITRFEVLADQEKLDEEVIRYSLIRMATMLREWVHEYPGDLSSPETYPILMGFYNRLLEHRHCADVVRVAEDSFKMAAFAPDLDAAWSARLNSHKPSSVAADYPPLNADPGSVMASPASGSLGGEHSSSGGESRTMPSVDVSISSIEGRPRADSGSIIASPSSLADSQSSAAVTDAGRLTAHGSTFVGRDRSSSSVTSASIQPSLTSSDSSTLLLPPGGSPNAGSSSASSIYSYSKMSVPQDAAVVKSQLRAASDALLEVEDAKIAQELTIMAWSIFMSIKPRDLLRHALVPIDQRQNGPCMQEIRHFNYISAWIVNMILAQSKTKNRSRLLEKFLKVAVRIRSQNDYATLYCIIGALESQTIYRLGNTWHVVDKDVLKSYQSLTKLMSPTKSYASYRLAIQNSGGRTIPHLGVIYQDLVSISAGNPSKTQVEGLVHWRKFELMNEGVSHFILCQQFSDSVGQSDPALRKHIMDLPIVHVEDEALMERSKTLEPTARVRRTDEAWMSALSRKGKKLFAAASSSSAAT